MLYISFKKRNMALTVGERFKPSTSKHCVTPDRMHHQSRKCVSISKKHKHRLTL